MTLEDRINDEMVADTESLLDAEFDRVNKYVTILEDGSVLVEKGENISWQGELLLLMAGREYAARVDRVDEAGVEYDFLYSRLDAGESTIRTHMSEMVDSGYVSKDEESGRWRLVPDRLSAALDYVEELKTDE